MKGWFCGGVATGNRNANENFCVYEALRNEIVSFQQILENLYMAMYASYLTLLVLALQFSHYILLCTFVIIIPFQARMIRFRWRMSIASRYIVEFFETERKDIHWERFNCSEEFINQHTMYRKNIAYVLAGTGSLQLGILSTGLFCIYTFYYKFRYGWIDVILLCISLIGLILTGILGRNNNKKYRNAMVMSLQVFKNKLYK